MELIIPVGSTSTSITTIMKSLIIPILGSHALIVRLDPAEITIQKEWDPENGTAYSAQVNGHWLGYRNMSHPDTCTIEMFAAQHFGELYNWTLDEDEVRTELTLKEHLMVIELLRDIHMEIVEKLEADQKHNPFRAHHQGVYPQGNMDRLAVARGIEEYLVKVSRKQEEKS